MKLKGIVTVRGMKEQTIDRNREAMRPATGIAGILQGIGAIP